MMELNNIFRTVMVLLASGVVVSIQSTLQSTDWLSRSVDAAMQEKRSLREDQTNGIAGNLMKADEINSCCFNGGICIMNSFCHCKKNFYGRYCEHRIRHQSCGTIRHGTWMAAGCHLCHCFDGKMTCKVTSIKGCDKLSYVEGYEKDPDYMVAMDKKVEEYDVFYDDVDFGTEEVSPLSGTPVSGTYRNIPVTSLVLAAVFCSLFVRRLAS